MNQTLMKLGRTGRSLERKVEQSHRMKHKELLVTSPKRSFGQDTAKQLFNNISRTQQSTEESTTLEENSVFARGQRANILTLALPEPSCMFNIDTQSVSYIPNTGVYAISNRDLINGRSMHFHNCPSVMCDTYCLKQCPENVHGLISAKSFSNLNIPMKKERNNIDDRNTIYQAAKVSPKSIQKAQEQYAHKYNQAL